MAEWLVAAVVAIIVWRVLVRPSLDRLPRPSEETAKDTMRGIVGFCRPHTIKGTLLASVSGYAVLSIYHQVHAYWCLTLVLISGLLANVFIVGINQLVDVEIDKVNKKNLPLVTRELTWETGRRLTGRTLVLAIAIAFVQSRVWGLTISCMCVIGIVYSVPPLRLKRFAVPAALCIVLARALLGTIGGVYTYSEAMGKSVDEYMQSHLTRFTGILIAFTTVIALMKDVPDIEGDQKEGVRSLSVVWGPLAVSLICFTILSSMYVVVISLNVNPAAKFSHIYGLVWLHLSSKSGGTKTIAMYNYFEVIWPLFYYEFFGYLAPIVLEQLEVPIDEYIGVFAFILGLEIAYLIKTRIGGGRCMIPCHVGLSIEKKSGINVASLINNLGLGGVEVSLGSSHLITEAAVEMSTALCMHAKLTSKLAGKSYRDAKKLSILCGDWLLARAVITLCQTRNQAVIHDMGKSILAASRKPESEIAQTISEFAQQAESHLVNS